MRIRPLACALPIVAVAGVLTLAACTSAPAKSSAAPSSTGVSSATLTGGHESVHFTAYTPDDGPNASVILTGAVGDYGKGTSVKADGSVDREHGGLFELRLAHGTFRLDLTELDKKFVAATATMRVNTTTCSVSTTVSSEAPVVAGSGTGAYQGIAGSFTLTATLDEVDRPGNCSQSSPLVAQAIVITGTGTVATKG